jgi:hypothetical protein
VGGVHCNIPPLSIEIGVYGAEQRKGVVSRDDYIFEGLLKLNLLTLSGLGLTRKFSSFIASS